MVSRKYLTWTESDTETEQGSCYDDSQSSRVTFGDVRVRRYYLTIGDNPAVSAGVPLGLSCEHDQVEQYFDLENYEKLRTLKKAGSKSGRPRRIPAEERAMYLRAIGYTNDSIVEAIQEVIVIKESRCQSYNSSGLTALDEYLLIAGVSRRPSQPQAKCCAADEMETPQPRQRSNMFAKFLVRRGLHKPSRI